MKLFLKIVLLVITPFLLSAQNYCNLKCETNIDSITGIPINEDLQCTIPSLPNVKILAHNVFETNSTMLKRYWNIGVSRHLKKT